MQFFQQCGGGTEQYGVAGEHGGVTDVLGDHGLAQSVATDQNQVAVFGKKANRRRPRGGGRNDTGRGAGLCCRGSVALSRSAGHTFAARPPRSMAGPPTASTRRSLLVGRIRSAVGFSTPTDPTCRPPAIAADPLARLLPTRHRRASATAPTRRLPRLPSPEAPAGRQAPTEPSPEKDVF